MVIYIINQITQPNYACLLGKRKPLQNRKAKFWILTAVLFTVFCLLYHFYFSPAPGAIKIALAITLLLKVGDIIAQYRANAITIDKSNRETALHLFSLLLAMKVKQYQLNSVNAGLIHHSGVKKFLQSRVIRKIQLPSEDTFLISSGHGFPVATPTSVYHELHRN